MSSIPPTKEIPKIYHNMYKSFGQVGISTKREETVREKMNHIIIQNNFTGKNTDYRKFSSIIMNPGLMCMSRIQKGLECHLYFVLGMIIYMEII